MIKQPFLRVGNPLAAMDYHAIAGAERELFPELVLPHGHIARLPRTRRPQSSTTETGRNRGRSGSDVHSLS
jgi:hypothetical protein